jgi:hypothetical protein
MRLPLALIGRRNFAPFGGSVFSRGPNRRIVLPPQDNAAEASQEGSDDARYG